MSTYAVVDPRTDTTVTTYPTMDSEAVAAAIDAADPTYRTWSRPASVAERAEVARRIGELHTARREQMPDIIVREMGKPRAQALGEVDSCAAIFAYYADHAAELLADQPIDLGVRRGTALIRRQPIGVLLGIMPWNFPYYQIARFAAPNVVAGNTLLLKPAPQCPESAAAVRQVFDDAGAAPGLYRTITIATDQVESVIADPRVQGVSLTGSERAGAAVASLAGKHLKKVVLELGGSDPFIVLSTDDMDATVRAAVGARLFNAGQACDAAKRFIVISDLYDEFLERFSDAILAAEPTSPESDGATFGPLSSSAATQRLQGQIDGAVAGGATITGGGHDGNFFRPAVMTGITPENDAFHQEFFGPVASVYRVETEDEAISLANATAYGLGSYVFTTDTEQAERVTNALEAGMVFVNTVGAESAELPFGGVKRSGFGRELGPLGIREFLNEKTIFISQK